MIERRGRSVRAAGTEAVAGTVLVVPGRFAGYVLRVAVVRGRLRVRIDGTGVGRGNRGQGVMVRAGMQAAKVRGGRRGKRDDREQTDEAALLLAPHLAVSPSRSLSAAI